MSKHTPGPWKAGSASVSAPETEDRLGLSVRIHGGNGADNRANARLIAAAPDLLSILEDVYVKFGDYRADWPGRHTAKGQYLLSKMRDTIAAATGRAERDVQDDYGTRLARAERGE